jgi:hypothetical protein
MFCSVCGARVTEQARFCRGCGSEIPSSSDHHEDSAPALVQISPSEILSQSQDFSTVFENESWVIDLVKKKWPKSNPGNYNRKVLGRFRGKLNPTGTDLEVIFTDEYLGLVIKGSPMGWPMPSFVHIHVRNTVKLVQVGSANYVHTSGSASRSSDWWTVSVILESGKELPIIYLPLGDSNYQQQQNSELYSAKFSILTQFWPVTLDGGHIESAGGYSLNFGVGFWNSVE